MAVAQLNELAQRQRLELRYEDVGSVGLDHIKTFTVKAVLNGKVYPDGVGKNKKEAKLNAATNALSVLLEETVDSTEKTTEASTAAAHQTGITQANYICWLNEHGHKNRVTIRAEESTRLGQNGASLCCRFVVGDKSYPAATAKTKKEAKEEAAKLVYYEICGGKSTETTSAQQQGELDIRNETRRLSLNSKGNSGTETNFIGIVNHYCQKTNRSHSFVEERRCGPAHMLQFFYKLIIDNKQYPVGEGQTAKEAKQNAAQLAWAALQEQTDWDSKVSVRSTEDGGPPMLTALKSNESSSQSTAFGTSGSIIFTDSSNSSKNQDAVKDQNTGNSQDETSIQSRFTSDFDSIEFLARGNFGVVYKAREKLLDRFFAVKVVGCEDKALREVGTLSDLLHHNIVRYYTSWMEDSGYQGDPESTDSSDGYSSYQSTDNSSAMYLYIQMELCANKTLRQWIGEKNAESLQDSKRREEGLSIAQQIVRGVEYIHSKKHIHRDLKPENILFGLSGEVKIGDFGLVTRDDDHDDALMERTEDSGTEPYMAPEQNKKNYDRKVDIFALGLIYLEVFWKVSTGHERAAILVDARRQKLPKDFLQTFPQEIQIIQLMLRQKPEERPEASKVKTELEKCVKTSDAQNMHQKNATV
ncbi:interferon-induced, double-stranded RNA-activated protein kinase-like [Anoplopoma fimbria]|uniref:interferon-induced, double-stranded RNA-activated protein kinase-like n=1 Tax=Anoplopoma fimbria TaxID=229290 RepID=UPI0023EBC15F|nr:interferon-induced, double-stranded RNA-activated protein kinase-like [Anoplopoma fimbria]